MMSHFLPHIQRTWKYLSFVYDHQNILTSESKVMQKSKSWGEISYYCNMTAFDSFLLTKAAMDAAVQKIQSCRTKLESEYRLPSTY